MTTTTCPSFPVSIFCGLKEGYEGPTHRIEEVTQICQAYCDRVGLCVTVTPTCYIYKGGSETGVIIGLINYPRFPAEPVEIETKAVNLARHLRVALGQLRVSVQTPNCTIMIDNDQMSEKDFE